MQRPFVKHTVATTVLAITIAASAAAGATELPSYEVSSFPATPLQVAVMTVLRPPRAAKSPMTVADFGLAYFTTSSKT